MGVAETRAHGLRDAVAFLAQRRDTCAVAHALMLRGGIISGEVQSRPFDDALIVTTLAASKSQHGRSKREGLRQRWPPERAETRTSAGLRPAWRGTSPQDAARPDRQEGDAPALLVDALPVTSTLRSSASDSRQAHPGLRSADGAETACRPCARSRRCRTRARGHAR